MGVSLFMCASSLFKAVLFKGGCIFVDTGGVTPLYLVSVVHLDTSYSVYSEGKVMCSPVLRVLFIFQATPQFLLWMFWEFSVVS